MKASDLVAPVIEPVANRYDRDWLELKDDRKVRGFDYKSAERRSREYVDPDTVSVTGGVVTGTVAARYDNIPTGFDAQDFEATLTYNPNAANAEDGGPEDGPVVTP